MLFDLKGKRRRAVQGTYLMLAVLMGAGLVLFGVGSSVNGGLGSLFGNGSSGSGDSVSQKQVSDANKALKTNPNDQAALKELVLAEYRIASSDSDPNTGVFGKTGKQHLALAATAWQRYLALSPTPDPALAAYMFQGYSEIGLNQPGQAEKAALIVAGAQPGAEAYVRVVQYAARAHDTRTVALASQKALQLAPPGQRATVKQLITQAKTSATSQAGQGGTVSTP